jgi:membrane protein
MAAYAPSLQMRVVRRPDVPGAQFELALMVLRLLDEARAGPGHGLGAAGLSERLRADPLQLEPLLEGLTAMGWVGRLDESGGGRYVLLADPSSTPAAPLLSALLLPVSGEVRGFWQHARLDRLVLRDLLAEV